MNITNIVFHLYGHVLFPISLSYEKILQERFGEKGGEK